MLLCLKWPECSPFFQNSDLFLSLGPSCSKLKLYPFIWKWNLSEQNLCSVWSQPYSFPFWCHLLCISCDEHTGFVAGRPEWCQVIIPLWVCDGALTFWLVLFHQWYQFLYWAVIRCSFRYQWVWVCASIQAERVTWAISVSLPLLLLFIVIEVCFNLDKLKSWDGEEICLLWYQFICSGQKMNEESCDVYELKV